MDRTHLRLLPRPDAALAECSDDELMTLAQAGLRDAYAVLVERHAARVIALCTRFVGERPLALELAQETWVGLWEQRARYEAQGQFIAWLLSAARNRCRNHVRHHAIARRHQQQASETVSEPDAPIERLLAAERQRQVERAVARLPAALREAVWLRFEQELRYEQMSQILRVGEGTLRSRVHHALRLLRRWLETSS
jgi:RNA polymerase sigma-70 factor (ECF subfamily)